MTAVEVLLPHFDVLKGRINRWGQTARDVAVVYGAHDIETTLERAGLRLQVPPVPESGAPVRPLYVEYELYSQTPEHLALVHYDPEWAWERTKSHERRIPERRRRERSSSPGFKFY